MTHPTKARWLVLALITTALSIACEEDTKEPAKTAAAKPPTPAPTPAKKAEPEPPKEVEKKPEQSPLEKCCSALARGGFSTPGPQRQNFMKGASACRDAVKAKNTLGGAKSAIKKAMGSATIPPDCL